MENRSNIIIVYLIIAILGFAWGYGLKTIIDLKNKNNIKINECYKYGGNVCE